jgi:hypothetical protein
MLAPGVTLTIRPKNEALHDAILSLALDFEGRQSDHYSGKKSDGEGDDLASLFVTALADCVEDGLPWHYVNEVEQTSQPRGKPEFAKSVSQFFSRGIMHKVVARRHERRQPSPFLMVVWSAYRCLPSAPGVIPSILQEAALLMECFDAPADLSVERAIEFANDLLSDGQAQSPAEIALLSACLALLDRDKRAGAALLPLPSGLAKFVDLEKIWERAVASLVAASVEEAGSTTANHGLAAQKVKLFGVGGPSINPDVVVTSSEGRTELIADAKYKVLADRESEGFASDVYQLTCYLERTESPLGMLVYVGMSDGIVELGETRHGARVVTVRISADRLISDGRGALKRLLDTTRPVVEAF